MWRGKVDIPLLVEKQNISASLEESVSGRETGKTASDNDDLCHYIFCVEDVGSWMEDEAGRSGPMDFTYRRLITGYSIPNATHVISGLSLRSRPDLW